MSNTVLVFLNIFANHLFTLTYWFSWMFLPFTRRTQAWVSKSISSTVRVSIVRTLLLEVLPVADSVWTFLRNRQIQKHWANLNIVKPVFNEHSDGREDTLWSGDISSEQCPIFPALRKLWWRNTQFLCDIEVSLEGRLQVLYSSLICTNKDACIIIITSFLLKTLYHSTTLSYRTFISKHRKMRYHSEQTSADQRESACTSVLWIHFRTQMEHFQNN